jgi:hypothetical protein
MMSGKAMTRRMAWSNTGSGFLAVAMATVASAQSTFQFDRQVGLATFKGAAGCLAIHTASLAADKRMTLVFLGSPAARARLGEARVVAKADSACDAKLGMNNSPFQTFYRIERIGDTTERDAVVVVDPVRPITLREGRYPVGDLDGDGALESFHSCTSSEGVHYRVWTGPVIVGRVRWHHYFYVGYDMVMTCPDLDFFATSDTAPPARPLRRAAEPERDILELSQERALDVSVGGIRARYGDPELATAVDALAGVPHPWTVPQMIKMFEEASGSWLRRVAQDRVTLPSAVGSPRDSEYLRCEQLARVLAASRDPRAALTLGKTIDGKEVQDIPGGGRILDALYDYFVGDINYGLPPEQWLGIVSGHRYDYTWPAVRRWWATNRVRLEAQIR